VKVLRTRKLAPILWSSQALWVGAGLSQKGLGFSLCAVPSQLAGPRISGLGRVESRQSLGGGQS
jgi:hypothetical protein